jgi:hypothetical protein
MTELLRLLESDEDCENVEILRVSYDKAQMKEIMESIEFSSLTQDQVKEALVLMLERSIHLALPPDHKFWSTRLPNDQ